jgi:hypothetical protein
MTTIWMLKVMSEKMERGGEGGRRRGGAEGRGGAVFRHAKGAAAVAMVKIWMLQVQ